MTRIGDAEVQHISSSVPGQSSSGTWEIARLDLDEFNTTLTVTDKLSNQANENGRVVVLKRVFTLRKILRCSWTLKRGIRDTGGRHQRGCIRCKRAPFPLFLLSHPGVSLTASPVRSCLQQEPKDIMTVKFRDPISAGACLIVRPFHHFYPPSHLAQIPDLRKMQGRFFAAVG